ncbi:MAG TPA: alpha/beta fold hydrolase [Candidatus Thermoplasmatota archaeon]|nr:alpha/beta fold hydrolase [Candidatus Thermoplasmatota archaeon]
MPRFAVGDVELHVELDGKEGAPLVVFLHGALAAGAAFRSQRVALRDEMRLAFVDLRGHGRSTHLGGAVAWDTLTYRAMTDDVLQLLPQLDARPVHLVGASLGGVLAARIAEQAPERVASLALLGTSGVAGPKRRAYFEGRTPESLPMGTQRLAALWHGEPYWRELARHIFARIVEQGPEVYPARLRVPRALVMQAVDDEVLEPREAEAWVDRIDAPTTLVRPPGDHAFFADGRSGSRAANAALRELLLR